MAKDVALFPYIVPLMIHDTRNNKVTAVGCEDVRRKAKSMGL